VNINLTLIGQMVAFIVFVAFCMKYVWPPIVAAMQERAEKIADGLAAADRASHDLELAQKRAVEQMKEAKAEAAAIIDAANKRANTIIEDAKAAARVEADRVKAAGIAELEQETNRARTALRAELAELTFLATEKVLGASVDRAAHAKLVAEVTAELH